MDSGSATTQVEFIPTHRLEPEFLGGLTRDLMPHAKALSYAAKSRGLMVLGVNRYRPETLWVRLEGGTKVLVPQNALTFAPTHWLTEGLLRQLPKDLQPHIGLLKRGASQGVVLVGSIGGNGQARSRVRFDDGNELEVPAWAVTDQEPVEAALTIERSGKKKPPYINNGGRFNGSRGR